MTVVTFFVLLADAILILALLWISTNALYLQRQDVVSALNTRRLNAGIRVLIIAPPLIVLAVVILFVLSLQNEFFARFTQVFYLLGLWMAALVLAFSLLLLMRMKDMLQLAAMLGFLCAIIPVLYFTPIYSFQAIFGGPGQIGYVLPLIEGALLIGLCYSILFRLNRALH